MDRAAPRDREFRPRPGTLAVGSGGRDACVSYTPLCLGRTGDRPGALQGDFRLIIAIALCSRAFLLAPERMSRKGDRESQQSFGRAEPSAAGRRGVRRRWGRRRRGNAAAADHCGGGLGQDPGARPSHRAPDPPRGRSASAASAHIHAARRSRDDTARSAHLRPGHLPGGGRPRHGPAWGSRRDRADPLVGYLPRHGQPPASSPRRFGGAGPLVHCSRPVRFR